MKSKVFFSAFLALLAAMGAAYAQVPAVMSYQGTLTDVVGVPVADGNYTVTFRIYEIGEGGAPVWTESHLLPVVGGIFGVVLGSVTPLDLPFDKTYYLGISIDGGAELSPRRKLTAAAYSLNAKAIDDGVAVKSLNGLRDHVALVGGENVTITQTGATLTVNSTGSGGTTTGANTLDAAYDEGGPGAGRTITADSGPVHVAGVGGMVVDSRVGVGVEEALAGVDVVTADVYAVYAETSTNQETGAGVFGILNNPNAPSGASGVIGVALDANAVSNGVWGDHASIGIGVFGTAPDGIGVAGFAHGAQSENVGVYGESAALGVGWAGYFYGDVAVAGQVYQAGGGAMLIDHPLEPDQKYLYHASVQSPDMMNIYNGNVILDGDGSAVVALPDYFGALNADFRYQLTAIGAPGPNLHVAQEINGNSFTVAGGAPGMKVSWTVTGIRKDQQAAQMDRTVVRDKPADKTGRYFIPAAYGMGREKSVLHAAHPGLAQRVKDGIRTGVKASER